MSKSGRNVVKQKAMIFTSKKGHNIYSSKFVGFLQEFPWNKYGYFLNIVVLYFFTGNA
jgi:hypothetical protein